MCIKKESHTINWTKTHTIKFLEVGTQKTTTIINLNVLQKWQNGMLDQQAMDKENLPHVHELKTKRKPPQINWIPIASRKGMWMDEALKTLVDVVERGICSLRKASRSWNIPLSSFFNHLNGKTRSRMMGPIGVFTREKDVVIKWTLNMQNANCL